MVERVMRALAEAQGFAHEDAAKAAIEAMREPTEAMWRVGSDVLCETALDEHAFAIQAQKVFRAMIDAALTAPPPEQPREI